MVVARGGASSWLGDLRPQNKNTIEPNRGLARGNRENVPPILENLKN